MNSNKVVKLLEEKQYERVIRVCEFELNQKQDKLDNYL